MHRRLTAFQFSRSSIFGSSNRPFYRLLVDKKLAPHSMICRHSTILLLGCFCFLLSFHSTSSFQEDNAPRRRRQLAPPFPNGPCGGEVITIPPEDTYAIDVNLANVNLGGDLILPPRPIHVWLPPSYKTGNDKHPVLYCHDGQNALQDSCSWTGASWRMAGALTRLADHGLIRGPLPILVLLESADGNIFPGIRRRHLEYGDVNVYFAQAHADFVAKTVKPLIDNQFRTNSIESYTIGSSLGGQASLHLLLRHPSLFAGAACMSPAFGPSILNEVRQNSQPCLKNKKIYLDIGGDFGDSKVPLVDVMDHMTTQHWWNPGYFWLDTQLQRSVDAMKDALDQVGVEYCFRTIPGGRHNERAWAQRIDKPLLYLFSSALDEERNKEE
jgi:pimeloyl-ACP methyl ester carboxylesterase